MIRRHRIPEGLFSALAHGAGGEPAMRFLAGTARSKHLLLTRHVVALAARIGHERAGELAEAYELLAALHEEHPAAVEQVLPHPPVGTWALRLSRALPHKAAGPVALGYLPGMAVAAAVRAGTSVTLEFTVPQGRVVLPSLGVARLPVGRDHRATRVTVRVKNGAGEVVGAGTGAEIPDAPDRYATGWTGVRTLTARAGSRTLTVLLDDLDPYRLPESRPAPRQRPAALERWRQVLEEGWRLLVSHHRLYAEEVAAGITTFVPMHRPRGRHVSATSRHAFGAFAVSLPDDGRILASLLAHEIQHAKLWALLDLVPLTEQAVDTGRTLWYAPWREDPRPLVALLQGAYAHLTVAAFWRVQRFLDEGEDAMRAHGEYARWRQHTSDVVDALRASGRLTPAGEEFVAGMRETLDGWRGDDVPLTAARRARDAASAHHRAWLERNRRGT
ncbi:HEXXH motif domain-containing protein [Thermopolyspora sp. NPDC052614]|uniref:HEXXH motif domain-containing protein n=1 Tax=Thermopolyspora sp. NPDC052614 TaxID=3155682 RepID=UPI0034258756